MANRKYFGRDMVDVSGCEVVDFRGEKCYRVGNYLHPVAYGSVLRIRQSEMRHRVYFAEITQGEHAGEVVFMPFSDLDNNSVLTWKK